MKAFLCTAIFAVVFGSFLPSADARKEHSFAVSGGVFANLQPAKPGGVVMLEFKLVKEKNFVLGLAPRASMFHSEIPITGSVNREADVFIGDFTLNLRLRFIACDWLALVLDLGGGLRYVRQFDAPASENMMFESGSHKGGVLVWGLALEFRINDTWRLSPFYSGGAGFNQLVELSIATSGPVKGTGYTHNVGAMVSIFFN